MPAYSRWIGVGVALGIIGALVPIVNGDLSLSDLAKPLARNQSEDTLAPPRLEGVDLTRLELHPRRVTTRVPGGMTAELTLDPELQRAATSVMKRYRVPEAGAVLMDVESGELLVYASHVEKGKPFDVNVRAEAPAASTFKVITAAALVESGGLNAHTEQCYHGGKSRISSSELDDDPERDRWCASLAMAMGRSLNVVFARLARKHLTPESLTAMGGAFGFGSALPFLTANEPPKIEIPDEPVEFARSAAGFWHTSLSPLAGASIAQTIANRGVALEPRMLRTLYEGRDVVWKEERGPKVLRRSIKPATAAEVTKMMTQTVASGSAYKAFHDAKGTPFLPRMHVAAKTGTLTRHKENRHYTWFIGFAPADDPQVAVSALVVNTPLWRVKAPDLARDVLRAYFAKRNWKGVSRP